MNLNDFSQTEKVNIMLVYGECRKSSEEARQMYAEIFLNRCVQRLQ